MKRWFADVCLPEMRRDHMLAIVQINGLTRLVMFDSGGAVPLLPVVPGGDAA